MANIKIESDGTEKGTKVSIDGKEVANLKYVSFNQYDMNSELYCGYPYFEYVISEKDGENFRKETRYTLTKAGIVEAKMDKPGALNYKKKNGKEKNLYAHPGKEAPELTKKKTSAMIKKVGNQYCVYKSDGKTKIACHKTRQEAVRQLQAIEISKHKK